ncbi:hypothetical protein NDU88_000015 [Pleurodeles waltl]|uniref:Secreted protein n=1 Tax=Pleurodeles waltl TaxID=8319 RepID=A0AAV7VUR3_PLEWA|nr:hypothetical protein NDU88_000015 [Pleurodeles waltl]
MPPVGALALLGPVWGEDGGSQSRGRGAKGAQQNVLVARGRASYPRPLRPDWEASEVSSRRPRGLLSVSRVLRCLRNCPIRSSTQLAGSDSVRPHPRPGCRDRRVRLLAWSRCPHQQSHVQHLLFFRNGGVLWRIFIRAESGAVLYATALVAMLATPPAWTACLCGLEYRSSGHVCAEH